jgi:hypothetical protein
MSQIRLSDKPSMVDPFLATVKLFADQLPPSVTTNEEPSVGFAGSVTIKGPEVVSIMYCAADCRVTALVILVQPATAPVAPVGPEAPEAPLAPTVAVTCHVVES